MFECYFIFTLLFSVPSAYLPLQCRIPCPPIKVSEGPVEMSDLCVSGRAFFNDICEFSCNDDLDLIG